MGCASSQPTSHTKQPLKQQAGKGSNIKPIPKVERIPQYVAPNDKNQFNKQNDQKNKNSNIKAESEIKKNNQKINESLAQLNKSKDIQSSKLKKDENQIQKFETQQKQQKKDKIISQIRQQQQNSNIKEIKNSEISNKKYSQVENSINNKHQSGIKQQVTEINKDINNISGVKASPQKNIYNQAGQISKLGYQSGVKKQSQLKLSKKFEQQVQPAKLGYEENKEIIKSKIQEQNKQILKNEVQQIPTIKKSQIAFSIRQTTSPQNQVPSSSQLQNAGKNRLNTHGNTSSQRQVTGSKTISLMGSNHVHSNVVDQINKKGNSKIQPLQYNTSQINEQSYQNSYDIKKSTRRQSEQPNNIYIQQVQVSVHEAPNKQSLISQVNDESLVISKEHNFDLGIQFNPQMLTIDMNRIGW